MCVHTFLLTVLCCVNAVVCTYFHFILSPLQKRHLNMTVQGHKTQKVLVMGRLIASISTTKTASELKPRLERVKLEWELVSSQLPLRIAELEYKRNVQVRAWSGRGGYFVVHLHSAGIYSWGPFTWLHETGLVHSHAHLNWFQNVLKPV